MCRLTEMPGIFYSPKILYLLFLPDCIIINLFICKEVVL